MPFKDPDKRRKYARDYRRIRRAGDTCSTPPYIPVIPAGTRLKTASDVLSLLEEQVGLVREEKTCSTVERSRAIGYLLTVALRALEAGNLAARIEMLEAVLKNRKEN